MHLYTLLKNFPRTLSRLILEEPHAMKQCNKSRIGTEWIKQGVGLSEDHVSGMILISFVEPLKCMISLAKSEVNQSNAKCGDILYARPLS